MGTVAYLATVEPVGDQLFEAIRDACAQWEDEFSTYRPHSALSLVNRGELRLTQSSLRMRETYALGKHWQVDTGEAFRIDDPHGNLDLNGVVKALAIAQAVELARQDCQAGSFSIGGDGEVWGETESGWVAVVAHPNFSGRALATVRHTRELPALATSGSAERGEHIWVLPGVVPLRQVTVAGPDIVTADVLATSLVAGGEDYIDEVCQRWPVEVLAVSAEGRTLASPGMLALIQAPGSAHLG